MSHIFYEANPRKGTLGFRAKNYHDQEATLYYMQHFLNECILCNLSKTERDFIRRRQIENELVIARRKMKYWSNHQNYNHNMVINLSPRVRTLAVQRAQELAKAA